MNIFKKYYNKLYTLFVGLAFGMKNTEEEILTTLGSANEVNGTTINQNVHSNRISQALLKGEVTQEVEQLRYRTYKVDREAKQYEYYSPTLALKKDKLKDFKEVNTQGYFNDDRNKFESKFVKYENEDNLQLITIQPNFIITESNTTINTDDIPENGLINKHEYLMGKKDEHIITIKRNFVSRYKIEEFCKRLVVRKFDDTHAILDFYVSVYPDDTNFKSKGFVNEVKKIKDDGLKSDILDFEEVEFTTTHAYHISDMIKFIFRNCFYQKVIEYDGHYILRFKSSIYRDGIDMTAQYYCKEQDDKYKNKEKKEIFVNVFGYDTSEKYTCDECGKEIIYDEEESGYMPIEKPRDIDENIDNSMDTMEFIDMRITEQTIGKRLCKDCLKKYLEKNNNNIIN